MSPPLEATDTMHTQPATCTATLPARLEAIPSQRLLPEGLLLALLAILVLPALLALLVLLAVLAEEEETADVLPALLALPALPAVLAEEEETEEVL